MAKRTNKSKEKSLVSPSLPPFGAKTEEVWKRLIISGYEHPYLISNFGNVKTLVFSQIHKPKDCLKQHKDKKGYMNVVILVLGKRRTMKVHRLVALMFVPNELGLLEVNHKDENKENNRADNLEWCNRVYNVRYGTGRERLESQLRMEISQYDTDGNLIEEWESVNFASRTLGIDAACITRCANGKIKTYHGCIWLYKDSENIIGELTRRTKWVNEGKNNKYGKMQPVGAYNEDGDLKKQFPGIRYAENFGFKSAGICKSIRKGCKHKGYYWKHI